jgi:hypothetical protein
MKSDNEHLISPIAILTDWVNSHAFEIERIYIIDERFIINLWITLFQVLVPGVHYAVSLQSTRQMC